MKTITSLVFALAIFFALPCHAQTALPEAPPPAASVPVEERQAWCDAYVLWLFPDTVTVSGGPSDVRSTQRFEVELRSCTNDPQQYQHDMVVEAIARLNQPTIQHTP